MTRLKIVMIVIKIEINQEEEVWIVGKVQIVNKVSVSDYNL